MKKTICLFFTILASGYAPHPPEPPNPDQPNPPEPPHPDQPNPPDPHHPDQPNPPEPPHPDQPNPPGPEHHHQDCHDPHCEQILNEVLYNISIYLNDDKCHIFRDLNCADHVIQNDEQICGTDGITYSSHCLFVKARCEKILNHENYIGGVLRYGLGIQHHGSCYVFTKPPLTTSVSKIMAAITTGISAVPTNGAVSTTLSFTTTSAPTTTDSGHVIVGGVFCQYKNSLNCISTLNMVCATNGKFYPNMCELLKVQCDNPTVTTAPDFNYCTLSP